MSCEARVSACEAFHLRKRKAAFKAEKARRARRRARVRGGRLMRGSGIESAWLPHHLCGCRSHTEASQLIGLFGEDVWKLMPSARVHARAAGAGRLAQWGSARHLVGCRELASKTPPGPCDLSRSVLPTHQSPSSIATPSLTSLAPCWNALCFLPMLHHTPRSQ